MVVCALVTIVVGVDSARIQAQFTINERSAALLEHGAHRIRWPNPSKNLYQADSPIIVVAPAAQVAVIERVHQALGRSVTLNRAERKLSDVIRELCEPFGLRWRIDQRGLEEAGLPLDPSVAIELSSVSLYSALDAVLQPLELEWSVRNEALIITSVERHNANLEIRIYPVGDIVDTIYDDGSREDDFDSLIEIITSTIAETTWDEVGGPGSIREFGPGHLIVVSQTTRVHDQIALMLSAIRKTKGHILNSPSRDSTVRYLSCESAARALPWKSRRLAAQELALGENLRAVSNVDVVPVYEAAVRSRLRVLLDKPISCSFVGAQLSEVARLLAVKTDAPWRLDLKSLEEAGIDAKAPVDYAASEVTLRSALNQMLGSVDLTYVIRGEAFLITTPESAAEVQDVRLYYVGDLVHPYENFSGLGDYDSLIELLTSVVAPTTWDEVGGPGSIREFAYAQSLIFSQSQEVHEQIELILAALRLAKSYSDSKPAQSITTLVAPPDKPVATRQPQRRAVLISNEQPGWRLPRVHD